jgi:hypothetical protein
MPVRRQVTMRKVSAWLVCSSLTLWLSAPISAQSTRVYAGGLAGASGGRRGPVDVGTTAVAGGLIGVRLSPAWSVELEMDRGFASPPDRVSETLWISYAPPGSSFAEIERLGVRARFVYRDRPGTGVSALAVWKSRSARPINVAVFGGLSQRQFSSRTIRTITRLPEDLVVSPNDPNVRDADEARTITGRGLTGGAMAVFRIARALTLSPEFRVTAGIITDESTYIDVGGRVRLMWGF